MPKQIMSNIHTTNTHKNEDIRVVYIGLHPDTLIYIDKTPLTVSAVSYLDFLATPTFNPVDILFTLAYILTAKKWPKLAVGTIFFLWTCVKILSSNLQIRYSAYVAHIIKNNILIIDATNTNTVEKIIRTHKIDIMVTNSWSLLPKKLIDMPPLGTINVHPSKLPQYIGALPTLWALKNKDSSSAISLIKLSQDVDAGPLLSQREFLISEYDNAIDIEHKIDDVLKKYLWNDLIEYIQKIKLPLSQSGKPSKTDKYMAYREIKLEYEKAEDIVNKILLYPYVEPKLYAYAYIQGHRIHFRNAELKKTITPLFLEKFAIKGCSLYIQTTSGSIRVYLLKDISILDSFFIIKNIKKINS